MIVTRNKMDIKEIVKGAFIWMGMLALAMLCLCIIARLAGAAPRVGMTSVEPHRNCPNMKQGLYNWIHNHLTRAGVSGATRKSLVASQLTNRILAEAKRFRLDPLVMATIAWIESDYVPWRRGNYGGVGRRRNEIGVWQIIPYEWSVRSASKKVAGCRPGAGLNRSQWRRYFRKYQWRTCLYPDIGKRRKNLGVFSVAELRDIYIGTFVAAYGLRAAIDACTKRTNGRGHKFTNLSWLAQWYVDNPNADKQALVKYAHHNWGSRTYMRGPYLKKLFIRYTKVRKGVCGR
jgi:hypothetical protein